MSPRQQIVDGLKECTKCNLWKPLDEFLNDSRTTSGKTSRCKQCVYSSNNNRYHSNPEFRERFKHHRRKSRLKIAYNLTIEEYNDMLEQQNYRCKICGIHFDRTNTKYYSHIDHCHTTGVVRGLLCALCNVGLGSFKDNIDTLYSAISYLKDNQ